MTTQNPHPDRRSFVKSAVVFGLAAAGSALGPYARPAIASMMPPAAMVGSPNLLMDVFRQNPLACPGEGADKFSHFAFHVESLTFDGEIAPYLEVPPDLGGWQIVIDPETFAIGAGAGRAFTVDAYPMVDAPTPNPLPIRVWAEAQPTVGEAFLVGPIDVVAIAKPEGLQIQGPTTFEVPVGKTQTKIFDVKAMCIDGAVDIEATDIPDGWSVWVTPAQVAFEVGEIGENVTPVSVSVTCSDAEAGARASFAIRARPANVALETVKWITATAV